MNHRVLVSGATRVGDPARALVSAALAEITGQPVDLFEARLLGQTPWLLDMASEAEARRLADWAAAAAGLRTSIVPSVGPAAPSRAAGLAFLEASLAGDADRVRTRTETDEVELGRRQLEAREKARVLAEERGLAKRPSGPLDRLGGAGGPRSGSMAAVPGELELDTVATAGRPPREPSLTGVERPQGELSLRPDRPLGVRAAIGVGVLLALLFLFGPAIVGPFRRNSLTDAVTAALLGLADSARLDGRAARQSVATAVRENGHDPERFEIGVFVAEDKVAVDLETERGFPARSPEAGVRLRARAKGDSSFLGRAVTLDVYVDMLVPTPHVQGRIETYSADFVRLDAR